VNSRSVQCPLQSLVIWTVLDTQSWLWYSFIYIGMVLQRSWKLLFCQFLYTIDLCEEFFLTPRVSILHSWLLCCDLMGKMCINNRELIYMGFGLLSVPDFIHVWKSFTVLRYDRLVSAVCLSLWKAKPHLLKCA